MASALAASPQVAKTNPAKPSASRALPVGMVAAFFLNAETVDPLSGIESEGSQFPAIAASAGDGYIQTPIRWRLRRDFAALKQELCRTCP